MASPAAPSVDDTRQLALAEHANRLVADWPPLSEAKLARIAALLKAGGSDAS